MTDPKDKKKKKKPPPDDIGGGEPLTQEEFVEA